ncbi:MAG: histidine phosphatase family protein [Candidatus Paceibacterota bacterium]
MVTIIFESHGTTSDNEAKISSGWFDVDLSDLGRKQAEELGERYNNDKFDSIFLLRFTEII